ncbi:KaiC domain-containing protein [Haloplanus rallus]|jgi:KaiC domain protein|uniref:KaiC domain-containing protein n=1 Tax=Haloplanus rallus TaxID=1816183 RepID=A0A6B9F6K3_9EURY|nr:MULTISPECIES: KaiC domain-containing protein [Haloplanus]QGX96165.1 KaiC domain-containing protein [Haloplanus rallus]
MSGDDDWFERAVGEADDDAEGDEERETTEPDVDPSDDDSERPDAEPDTPDPDAFEGFGDESGGSGAAVDPDSGDDDGSPFEEDFASAFQNAPDPEGGFGGGGPGPGGGPGEAGPEADFGGGSGGPGAPDGASAEDFDENEFESAIERIDLGIDGLDDMILGGVPKRSLISVIGSAGTGKTTFGLQFLNRALADGKRGVYVTLEESTDRIYDTAEEKGWSFVEYADEERLAIVHLDPVEMANSLSSIRNDLPDLVKAFGADRLVLDSVSLLEMMYDHPSDRRSEVYQFTRSLKEAGVTTLVTSEASGDNPYSSRYGIIEYLADAVFVLQYVRPSDFQETRLAVEIQKIRDANHSRETKPYEITNEGLSVYRQANIF